MKPIPFNINNGNLIKTLSNKNFQYLASQLDSVAELHRKVCTHEGEIRSLKELYRIKVQNQAFFSDLSKRTPLSPTFTSSVHPMKQNINPTQDFRKFNCLNDFTDANILYNVQTQCFSKTILTSFEINETKNSVYVRLLAYRDACLTGDTKQIALLLSQTYVENTTSSEPFHSFEFEFKKKIFEVAQNENRFITSSSLSFSGLQQAASMREIPKNLFVDKNSNIDIKGQSSYNTVQELAVTSLIASGHTHYLYYVTCDRSQQDIDNWLLPLGYSQVGQINQARPDLVIIDFHNKKYMYWDIKNCTLQNSAKYLAFDDQLAIFFGHMSLSDRTQFISMYRNKQILGLSRVISDPKSNVDAKNEAQLLYNKLLNGNFSDEEILNLDPFISTTSSVATPENINNTIDPHIFLDEY